MKKFLIDYLLLRILLPAAIIGGGVAGARYLKNQAKPAKQRPPEKSAPLVETVVATSSDVDTYIKANGTTMPARKVTLAPEVSGRLIKVSKALVPGNHIKKNQILAKVDQRDYLLAMEQEVSQVEQANLALQQEQGRKEIAVQELKLLGKDKDTAVSALATRTPQLQVAKQNTAAAKSGLERAKLNLARTILRAPFNSMVLEKHVDKGQLVGPTTSVATLIGTDELWVNVSVNVEQLGRIRIPGVNATKGSAVKVIHQIGPKARVERQGEVLRLQGELDPQNRTAQLLVTVPKPFEGEGLPLLSGAYVSVEIEGEAIPNGFRLPREAVRDGKFVWVVSQNSKLTKKRVDVAWGDRAWVVISSGIDANDAVVTSPLVDPIDGMLVTRESTSASLGAER